MYEKTIEPVAIMHTGFGEKFGIPRQSGLVPEAAGQIVFEPKYQNPDALRGIEEFTHLWIIWGREKRGVFATRSPFRPNGMGLSSVRLDRVEYKNSKGPIIHVSGVDMLDGTPIYDIKPYLAYSDSHPEASDGFAAEHRWDTVHVIWRDEALKSCMDEDTRITVEHILAQDPRAAYNKTKDYIYGMRYGRFDIRFVADSHAGTIEIVDVVECIDGYHKVK